MTTVGIVCGLVGGGLTVASCLMRSMLPLRLVALAANLAFVAYGYIESAIPSLALYLLMIPINAKKAWDIRNLVRAIEHAKSDAPVAEWLLPHMKRRTARAGETLWQRGDHATDMLYVESGTLRLVEHGTLLGPGELVGEIGLFSPDNRRTLTLACETNCVLHSLTAEAMAQLYYQNPKLGFHVMRLVVARLMNDTHKARAEAEKAA